MFSVKLLSIAQQISYYPYPTYTNPSPWNTGYYIQQQQQPLLAPPPPPPPPQQLVPTTYYYIQQQPPPPPPVPYYTVQRTIDLRLPTEFIKITRPVVPYPPQPISPQPHEAVIIQTAQDPEEFLKPSPSILTSIDGGIKTRYNASLPKLFIKTAPYESKLITGRKMPVTVISNLQKYPSREVQPYRIQTTLPPEEIPSEESTSEEIQPEETEQYLGEQRTTLAFNNNANTATAPPTRVVSLDMKANNLFLQCCKEKHVDPRCESRCNFDNINKKVLTGMFLGSDPCPISYGRTLMSCAAQDKDHSMCCKARGVHLTKAGFKCLKFCEMSPTANFQPDVSYLPCWGVLKEIKQCFKDSLISQLHL